MDETRRIAQNEARADECRMLLAGNQDRIVCEREVLPREDLKSESPLGDVSFGHRIRRMCGLEWRKDSTRSRRLGRLLVAGGVFIWRQNAYETTLATFVFEENHAIHAREERVVLRAADIFSGLVMGAALADQYAAARDELTAKALDSEALALGVASVCG